MPEDEELLSPHPKNHTGTQAQFSSVNIFYFKDALHIEYKNRPKEDMVPGRPKSLPLPGHK